MSSAYGTIDLERRKASACSLSILPLAATLRTGEPVLVRAYDPATDGGASDASPSSLSVREQLRAIFNEVIEAGCTYAHEHPVDQAAFHNYFLSNDCFLVVPRDQPNTVLGTFYGMSDGVGGCVGGSSHSLSLSLSCCHRDCHRTAYITPQHIIPYHTIPYHTIPYHIPPFSQAQFPGAMFTRGERRVFGSA